MVELLIAYAVLVVILMLWGYVGNKCATSDREICTGPGSQSAYHRIYLKNPINVKVFRRAFENTFPSWRISDEGITKLMKDDVLVYESKVWVSMGQWEDLRCRRLITRNSKETQ